LHEMKCKK